MKVIHICRKPLSKPTVAANVLKHGTGALNIDDCRTETGRWPPNVILEHLPECRCVGEREIKLNGSGIAGQRSGINGYDGGWGAVDKVQGGYATEKGKEKIPAWECAPGCPILELDSMGVRRSSGIFSPTDHHPTGEGWATSSTVAKGGFGSKRGVPASMYEDHGGASRFFKQVGGSKTEK